MPQPDHIVKISLPELDSLDEDTKKYFSVCEEKLGMVPNVLRAYTGNIEKFRNFTAFYNKLMLDEEDCNLTKLEREMIAVVVSSANRCYYCLVAHGQAVRQLSGDPQLGEMMVMNYHVAELDERTRIMLDFAWKLTKSPHDIGDVDRDVHGGRGRVDMEVGEARDQAVPLGGVSQGRSERGADRGVLRHGTTRLGAPR